MTGRHSHREDALSAHDIKVQFSPQVKSALRSLASATANSEHFDSDIHVVLERLCQDGPPSLHTVMIAWPVIAEEMASHVNATRDQTAIDAWRELCDQMPENGFAISRGQRKAR